MDVRTWVLYTAERGGISIQDSPKVADALVPAITKMVDACRAMRCHSDTCQFILITDREIPFPCNCGYALAQAALAELGKP